jgi:glycosyltransferase involved in cell wall biosynthesis
MSILEAMAYGLPVVAPAVGGLVEIISDGVDGFLVNSRDPLRYAEACNLLIHDPELRNRMGQAAREKVEQCFSAEVMAQNYSTLYHELASAS